MGDGVTEIEKVRDVEVASLVEDKPDWESLVSEWAEGASLELEGQLRQARAAAGVVRSYGMGAMEGFAYEVGCSKTKVYDYARVWAVYGHIFEGEHSGRLETLGITHLVKSLSAPDPLEVATEAHDEGLTTRQTEERAKERTMPKNVETITYIVCPECGVQSPMSKVETRTEAV